MRFFSASSRSLRSCRRSRTVEFAAVVSAVADVGMDARVFGGCCAVVGTGSREGEMAGACEV